MITVIITLILMLFSYVIGKYHGEIQGYKKGTTDSLLVLRQQSLSLGYCSICTSCEEKHEVVST